MQKTLNSIKIKEAIRVHFEFLADDIVDILIAIELEYIEKKCAMVLDSNGIERLAKTFDKIMHRRMNILCNEFNEKISN